MSFPKMRNLAAGSLLAGLLLTGCGDDIPVAPSPPAPSSPSAATKAAAKLRVAALMKKAKCDGKVIGTQLYSYETGRCDLADGGEITVAVFESNKLRDEWVKAGKEFGGNYVTGPLWAAVADSPAGGEVFATANGGQAG